MKKICLAVFCLAIIGVTSVNAAPSVGGFFGTLQTGRSLGMGQGTLGGAVGIADATSVFGTFAYGASDDVDVRLKAGLVDGGADTEFTLGADFKYQIWRVTTNAQNVNQSKNPFDLALGGMFEYVKDIWQLGAFAVGSYPFALNNGMTLSPYGRFNVRLQNVKYPTYNPANNTFGDETDSDIKFGLNGGVALKMTSTVTAYGEFQIDGNDGVFLGLDFLVL